MHSRQSEENSESASGERQLKQLTIIRQQVFHLPTMTNQCGQIRLFRDALRSIGSVAVGQAVYS